MDILDQAAFVANLAELMANAEGDPEVAYTRCLNGAATLLLGFLLEHAVTVQVATEEQLNKHWPLEAHAAMLGFWAGSVAHMYATDESESLFARLWGITPPGHIDSVTRLVEGLNGTLDRMRKELKLE